MRKIIFNSNHKLRPIWRLSLFLVITFLINIPLQLLLQNILSQGLVRGFISASIYFLSFLFSLYLQVKFIEKSSFEKYGLKFNRCWWEEFFIGILISMIQLILFFAIIYSTGNLRIVGFFTTNHTDFKFSFLEGFFSEMYGLVVGTSVEEIFFRSFLFYIAYEALRTINKNGKIRAYIILFLIAPLFGIAHIGNEGMTTMSVINLSIDAMMMCVPFLITGRLGMSIGLHFSWNLIQGAVFGFAISGNTVKASILNIEVLNNILTGGVFGPEGSILFIVLDIIAIMIILYWKNLKSYHSFVHPRILNAN